MKKPVNENGWKEYRRQQRISEKYLRFKSARKDTRFILKAFVVLLGLIVPILVFIFEKPHFGLEGKGSFIFGLGWIAAFLLGTCLGEASSDEVWLEKLRRRHEH